MSKYILPTFTGKLFDLENPKPEMICIEDIAHHLAYENRYNGATKFPYPVAYHCLLGIQFAPEELKLEFLLHDREEAYYKDWPSPLKVLVDKWTPYDSELLYSRMTAKFEAISIDKFKLSKDLMNKTSDVYSIIRTIDLRLCSTEILQLCPKFPTQHWRHSYNEYPHYQSLIIREMLPSTIEQMFNDEFFRLKRS